MNRADIFKLALVASLSIAGSSFAEGESLPGYGVAGISIPSGFSKGRLDEVNRMGGYAILDGKRLRLAPGFWIKDKRGRILGDSEWNGGEVMFKTDTYGQLWRAFESGD